MGPAQACSIWVSSKHCAFLFFWAFKYEDSQGLSAAKVLLKAWFLPLWPQEAVVSSWFPSQLGTSGKLSAFLSVQLCLWGSVGVRLLHASVTRNANTASLRPVEPLEITRGLKMECCVLQS